MQKEIVRSSKLRKMRNFEILVRNLRKNLVKSEPFEQYLFENILISLVSNETAIKHDVIFLKPIFPWGIGLIND